MDAHLFRRCCDALTPLLQGARLEKLQEPAPGLLALTFFGGGRKRLLCLRHGRKDPFLFVTEQRLTAGIAPSAAVMRLRKYAAGRRVAACVPCYWARQLWLLPAGSGSASLPWLVLDLREGPGLRFLASDATPEEERPAWPEPQELAAALQDWRSWPVLTPALRRTLALLEPPEQWALLEDLRQGGGDIFLYALAGGPCRAVSAWPLPAPLREGLRMAAEAAQARAVTEQGGDDILPLLERAGADLVLARLAADAAKEADRPLSRRETKLRRLLDKLREEEARLTGMCAAGADALALQAELWRWPADLRAPSVKVSAGAHGPAREIALDPRYSVREAMTRFFHTAARGKRGLVHLGERRAALEAELAALRAARGLGLPVSAPASAGASADVAGLAAAAPRNVQVFVSEDGFVLLRGRDAKGNLAARKLAAPHDIWLHAENGPGAHVIIRRAHAGQEVPARTLDQAGSLAAGKSWQKDAARARIQYAEVRHVKPLRRAPAGTVRVDKVLASREVPVDPGLETQLLPQAVR